MERVIANVSDGISKRNPSPSTSPSLPIRGLTLLLLQKVLLLLSIVVDINCNIRCRSRNTLRFPRVTREPPRTIVLRGLTLATIPAGVSVYFLRWFCALQLHPTYLLLD